MKQSCFNRTGWGQWGRECLGNINTGIAPAHCLGKVSRPHQKWVESRRFGMEEMPLRVWGKQGRSIAQDRVEREKPQRGDISRDYSRALLSVQWGLGTTFQSPGKIRGHRAWPTQVQVRTSSQADVRPSRPWGWQAKHELVLEHHSDPSYTSQNPIQMCPTVSSNLMTSPDKLKEVHLVLKITASNKVRLKVFSIQCKNF